jgi:transketolase
MEKNITGLEQIAREMRARIIETSHKSQTPHLGSCLSTVEVLVAAYFEILRIDPKRPADPGRDRFILSKGHAAPALFQVLARRGYYAESMLDTYGEDGGVFAEHPPTPAHLPGIEAATGSLGHGFPMGLGMALAGRIQGLDYRVFALLSDGECNEGSTWEAAMLAGSQKVGNLMAIVDFNKWQATGRSEDIMGTQPLVEKWRAFGWIAHEIDGNDMGQVLHAMRSLPDASGKPVAVVAHTVKGKGVSFMENDNNWHYRIPTDQEVRASKLELGIPA